jgi:hypothetical protein
MDRAALSALLDLKLITEPFIRLEQGQTRAEGGADIGFLVI